jgi:hypothetical protein
MKITIYRGANGWQLAPSEGAVEVVAELKDGYRVMEGVGNEGIEYYVFQDGDAGGLTAEQAIRRGVLSIPGK